MVLLFSAITALKNFLADANQDDPIQRAFYLHDALLRFFFELLRLESLIAHVNPFFLGAGALFGSGAGPSTSSTKRSTTNLEYVDIDSQL